MDLDIAGRSALIVGGSRGIGLACALMLAREGASITIVGRTEDNIDRAAATVQELGLATRLDTIVADVTTEDGFGLLRAADPSYDIAIIVPPRTAECDWREIERQALATQIATTAGHLTAITAHLLTGMVQRRFGRIVNVFGTSVKMPDPGHIAANIARTGQLAASASFARAIASHGVTMNSVLVGLTSTESLLKTWEKRAQVKNISFSDYSRARLANVPIGRLGTPDEAASLCVYLCSGNAAFITGQCIVADGGAIPTLF